MNSVIRKLERYILIGWAGRQFDSVPELAMHLGIWVGMFAVGLVYGHARPDALTLAPWILVAGGIIGVAGQIAVEFTGGNDV